MLNDCIETEGGNRAKSGEKGAIRHFEAFDLAADTN